MLDWIYLIFAFAVGVFVGIVVELAIDSSHIKALQDQLDKSRLECEQNRRTIEITDTRTSPEDLFKPW